MVLDPEILEHQTVGGPPPGVEVLLCGLGAVVIRYKKWHLWLLIVIKHAF